MQSTRSENKGQSSLGQPTFAAIDLGSNSFHMVLARLINGQIQIIDKRGEKVQLAHGLNASDGIHPDAQQRALACLERFAQHLRGLERYQVTVLGTNTLRSARNSNAFMQQANEILGFPIEVISGVEEARLVYLGVAHTLADDEGKRLVIDIGGGSTEFIIGERFAPLALESLHMGCVTYSDRYFVDGQISELAFNRATRAAKNQLLSIRARYKQLGWQNAVGSSGTMRATSRVLKDYGLSDGEVTLKALLELKTIILQHQHVDELVIEGIKDQRLKVYPAGLAILIGIFEALEIDTLNYSDGALREGALYDLLGRVNHEDVREKTVVNMQKRFVVDQLQADRIKDSALQLYEQVKTSWKLDEPEYRDWLRWACDLHEVGLSISHSQFHKHGAYLLEFSDMHGFSKQIQKTLALMVRAHRRKLPINEFDVLPKRGRNIVLRLTMLLRLAVLLHHGREAEAVALPKIEAKKYQLKLEFEAGYLEQRPMTKLDLKREIKALDAVSYTLLIS